MVRFYKSSIHIKFLGCPYLMCEGELWLYGSEKYCHGFLKGYWQETGYFSGAKLCPAIFTHSVGFKPTIFSFHKILQDHPGSFFPWVGHSKGLLFIFTAIHFILAQGPKKLHKKGNCFGLDWVTFLTISDSPGKVYEIQSTYQISDRI